MFTSETRRSRGNSRPSLKDVREDVVAIKEDLTHLSDDLAQAASDVVQAGRDGANVAMGSAKRLVDYTEDGYDEVRKFVVRRPVLSAMIAAGICAFALRLFTKH